jgi:chromosome segregation protein
MPSLLKSLELHGYKTFANRTLFAFSDSVTAIVGPNGSGKSNIADSLRWVLGEQSYGLLRAKRTEDMIFSGSESRPRAGMASASITFDNSEGWLPIDFSEVAITRRAYRDGDNEYLINGQRVRLRDVSELLAKSGLAERTYTVIGQGLVDAALSLKAEERRRLFEEAAGIGLHRSRREDALRRLDATRRNLERVEDILAELQPRLQSLERQARRAREYEQVKADLRVLLRDWYGYHWHDAQHELAEARVAAHIQESRVEKARQEQATVGEGLSNSRNQVQTLRSSLNQWHKQLAQLHAQHEAFSRDLAVSEERSRSLEQQQREIQLELSNLEQEAGLFEVQLETAVQEVERLSAERDEAHTQELVALQALEARQRERLEAEENLRETRQQASSLNARQGQLQALIAERQLQAERAQRGQQEALQAVTGAEEQFQRAEFALAGMIEKEQTALQERNTLEESLRIQRERVEAVEQNRKQLLEERAAVAAERSRLSAQGEVLEQAEAALTGYASGTRILLQARRQGDLQGVMGALSEHLRVPVELETAIGAALGEYLDAVALASDPEQALNLMQSGAGRGMLLPLGDLKIPEKPQFMEDDPAVLGIASNLVETSSELRPVVDLLLSRTLVVKDRQAARQALQSVPTDEKATAMRAVTLNGEVFHIAGPIFVFGTSEGASTPTVLSRARQRREIAANLESLEGRWQSLEGLLEQADRDLQELHKVGEQLQLQHQTVRQAWEQASQVTSQARLALEQARRQMQWQRQQVERLQAEISHSEVGASTLESELAEIEGKLSQLRQRQRQESTAFEALSLDEFQAQVSHWQTRSAVAERALADAQLRQQERQAAINKLIKSRTGLQGRLEEFGTLSEKLAADRVELRRSENEIGEQIRMIQAEIEPSETELGRLEMVLAEDEKTDAAARQSLSLLERYYSQARINLDRRQESLATLRRRIEEDFGLVAFEYAEQISGPTPLPLEGMVEQLPVIKKLPSELEEAIRRQRAQLRRMGAINPEAQAEYHEVKQRFEFLTAQVTDLHKAEEDVRQVIAELDTLMEREFRKTFQAVAIEFRDIFTRLFGGGSARLILTDPDNMTATGIDIEARLPGRRTQGLSLLSGGERSLTAVALIFSLLRVSPTPFCVLDEVDAMLDEMNVGRFRELLRELSQNTQFVIVTHNRNTVQVAEVIYGVTMGHDSASQVLSLKLDEVGQLVE